MSEYTDIITKLYIGYFNRLPDPAGLQYWTGLLVSGEYSLDQLVESFADSEEAVTAHPYLADPAGNDAAQFISAIYLHAFGRLPDPEGLAYWQHQLEVGYSPSSLVWHLIQAADSEAGSDSNVLQNRVAVSSVVHQLLADQWDDQVGGLSRQILTTVDAQQPSVDGAIYQLLTFVKQHELMLESEQVPSTALGIEKEIPDDSVSNLMDFTGEAQTVVVIDSAWSNYWDSGDVVYSWDFADNDGDVLSSDPDGHGAWVTQVLVNVAPDAQVIRLKVFSDNNGLAAIDALEHAFAWVLDNVERYSIDVVNLSLGSGNTEVYTSTQFSDDYAALAEEGVITTIAAGNHGEIYSSGISLIAADPNVIAVSASDGEGQMEPWSQHHPELTNLAADGSWHLTDLTGYEVMAEGTSFSAPSVAGAALLAQQAAEEIRGEALTPEEFLAIAQESGNAVAPGEHSELDIEGLMAHLIDYLNQPVSATKSLDAGQVGFIEKPPESFDAMLGQHGGGWDEYWADEQVSGTADNEYFSFNYGDDVFTGGGGADVFQFNAVTGHDHIMDFDSDNDFLDLGAYAYQSDSRISATEGHTLISLADGLATIRLQGVTSSDWGNLRDVEAGNLINLPIAGIDPTVTDSVDADHSTPSNLLYDFA